MLDGNKYENYSTDQMLYWEYFFMELPKRGARKDAHKHFYTKYRDQLMTRFDGPLRNKLPLQFMRSKTEHHGFTRG